jgi:hypothetical protein
MRELVKLSADFEGLSNLTGLNPTLITSTNGTSPTRSFYKDNIKPTITVVYETNNSINADEVEKALQKVTISPLLGTCTIHSHAQTYTHTHTQSEHDLRQPGARLWQVCGLGTCKRGAEDVPFPYYVGVLYFDIDIATVGLVVNPSKVRK